MAIIQWSIAGRLTVEPALDRLDQVADPVASSLSGLPLAETAGVAEIDPSFSDTAALCEFYGTPLSASANCVVVRGKRAGEVRYAACVALATTRINVNSVVKETLDVRKISFAPADEAVELSGMEFGAITPIGLPKGWALLLDSAVAAAPELIIGSGVRASKLFVSGDLLASLPMAETINNLAE